MDDARLIAQLTAVTNELRRRPAQNIAPYSAQINEISLELSNITAGISRRHSEASVTPSEHLLGSSSPQAFYSETPNESTSNSGQQRQNHPMEDALAITVRNIPSLLGAMQHVHAHNIVFTEDLRLSHVQLIFEFQGVALPTIERIRGKFQLMLGCWSLAQDFRAFEKSQRWTPKMDILIKRALNCEDAISQQPIGRHLKSFISQFSVLENQHTKLDASIRFGIKLQLLIEIGISLGLGVGLSLMMGFEGYKISRMKFEDLSRLRDVLEQPSFQSGTTRDFCKRASVWWETNMLRYHKHYELMPSDATDIKSYCVTSAVHSRRTSMTPQPQLHPSPRFSQEWLPTEDPSLTTQATFMPMTPQPHYYGQIPTSHAPPENYDLGMDL